MTRVAVLVGSLRADSVNRQVAEKLQSLAPAGVEVLIVDGLADVPFYNEDIDGETARPPPRPSATRSPRPTAFWSSPPSTTRPCRQC